MYDHVVKIRSGKVTAGVDGMWLAAIKFEYKLDATFEMDKENHLRVGGAKYVPKF